MAQRTIIGLVGPAGSGKDTVSNYLVERHGFVHVSTGDLIRQYIRDHDLGELNRPLERKVATELRAGHGADYLVRLALQQPGDRLVISGLRAPAEVEAVRTAGGRIVAVIASQRLRYDRSLGRGRGGDRKTFAEFQRIEAEEAHNPDPNAQNVAAVTEMATVRLDNDGDLAGLQRQVDALLQ